MEKRLWKAIFDNYNKYEDPTRFRTFIAADNNRHEKLMTWLEKYLGEFS